MKVRKFEGLRVLFGKRDFRKLCIAQVFGGMGEFLATLALIGFVYDRTHSAFLSGVVLASRILPAALIGASLSAFVDRFDRRKVLIFCTFGRATIYGILPLVGGVAPVLALALVAEVGTLAYMAARDATLPRLVPEESLPTANALSMVTAFGSMPLGWVAYTALTMLMTRLGHPGQAVPFLAAAGMLYTATLLIGQIASASGVAVKPEHVAGEHGKLAKGALRAVLAADPVLKKVIIGGAIMACCGGSLITLGISYVRGTLHASNTAYGGLMMAFCFGAVTGVIALQRARKHMTRVFHLGGGTMGVILILMAMFPSTIAAFFMAYLFGCAVVAAMLGLITILQERVHDAVRGRMFTLAHSSLRVGAVAVGLLAAWCAKMLGSGHVIWTMDGTQVVFGLTGLTLFAAAAWLLGGRVRPVAVATA
ncbi:MAG TPA: MFS transporter [Actinomycetota bacterium]|nr:MFS transporter [Actinomycetota bacterium]